MSGEPIDAAIPIAWAPIVGVSALSVGVVLLVAGVFVLAGIGWALIALAVPCLGLAAVIFRGLLRG